MNVGAPYKRLAWTGADMSVNGSLIALRTGADVYYFARQFDQSVLQAISCAPCPYIAQTSRNLMNERQFESVAFAENFVVAEISECQDHQTCEVPVYFYDLVTKASPVPGIPSTPSGSTRVTIRLFCWMGKFCGYWIIYYFVYK